MELNSAIDVTDEQREIVSALLRKHLPDTAAWVYGSRAKWTAGPKSDLNLVVFSTPEQDRQVSSLRDAFEESNLPFRVELLVWARLPERFHREIEREHVVFVKTNEKNDTAGTWPRSALEGLIDLRISSVDKKTKPAEHPVRLCNYTDVYRNFFIHSELNFMSATATEREISKFALCSGDVVITKDSEKHDDIGVPALVREDVPNLICGYHLAILRPASQSIDGAYLFYALRTHEVQKKFHSYANGVTRFGLRKADIGRVEIPLPPISEQRAIAHILGALDDKIETNRRMNETLEAMAQAVFKDWFVDFGPTRAKAAGRDPYLPEPLWSLFPDRLVDSELGEIPEGWEIGSLADIAEHIRDQERPYDSPNTLYHHFSIPAFDENRQPKIECGKNIKSQKFRVPPEATLLSRLNPEIERVWLADVNAEDQAVCSTEFLVLQSRRPYGISFPYCLGRSYQFRQAVNSLVTGTSKSHQRAPVDAVLSLPVVLSPESISDEFENMVAAYLKNNRIIRRESFTLSQIRNTLLPKLVSGDIRVPGL